MAHILPSGGGKALINTEDSLLLLLDHQSGLFQTVMLAALKRQQA
jgi:hypothetical protein